MLLDNSFIILKYSGFSDRAQNCIIKGEQKDRIKTLAEFPDYIFNDCDTGQFIQTGKREPVEHWDPCEVLHVKVK